MNSINKDLTNSGAKASANDNNNMMMNNSSTNGNNISSSGKKNSINGNFNSNNNPNYYFYQPPINKAELEKEKNFYINKFSEEEIIIEQLLKEKEEYSRYLSYLTKPIFGTFEEFYAELKKLEKDNITYLNKFNENNSILHRLKMESYTAKAEEDRIIKKYTQDIFYTQQSLADAKAKNKDLKNKLNSLLIAKLNTQRSKAVRSANKQSDLRNSSSTNFYPRNNYSSNYNTSTSESLSEAPHNGFSKTLANGFGWYNTGSFAKDLLTYGACSMSSSLWDSDYSTNKGNKAPKKPGYFNSVVNTFNLACELKKFDNTEMLKNVSFEDQALQMLMHIEHNLNNLLHKHSLLKTNPQTRAKLTEVTNEIDKENRARKCAERMQQVLENHEKMIERVNYKFNRINVLPKRKCPPRFKPRDPKSNKLSLSFDLNKKIDEEEDDFLDII